MRKKEKGRMSFSKKLGLCLLLVWVAVMAGATVWSLGYEKSLMPEVWVGYPEGGTVVYNCQVNATVLSEEEAELMVPHTFHLNSRLFQEGTDLGIGTVTFHENGVEGHYMKIRLKEAGTVGEELPVEINYANDYDQVVEKERIHFNDAGMPCIYQVVEEEGAWGKERRLRETDVICFPADISTEQVAILSELENPMVMESSGELKGGERVKVAAFGEREAEDASIKETAKISPNRKKAERACNALAPENAEKLFRDIEAINAFRFIDSRLYYNLEYVYEDYFVNDTITAEECGEELANRVYLYRNE